MRTQEIEGTSSAYTNPLVDVVSATPHSDGSVLVVFLDKQGSRVTLEFGRQAATSLIDGLLEALQIA